MIEQSNFAPEPWPSGKVGYVALLGRPNTGKSTFLNTVLKLHLAAVSAKPQTTRCPQLGILTDEQSQILFVDAPGVHQPRHALGEAMAQAIARRLDEADVVLCLADATRAPGEEDGMVAEKAGHTSKTTLLAVNKTDVATPAQIEQTLAFYQGFLPNAPAFTIAAIDRHTLTDLLAAIKNALPEGPFLYPPDALTETYERQIGAELIRETCLDMLREEVPHGMAVTIEAWQEQDALCRIEATLHVDQERHKSIVIGRNGQMIKRLCAAAAAKIEELRGEPVRLKLWVKADPHWQRKRSKLKEFGLWT